MISMIATLSQEIVINLLSIWFSSKTLKGQHVQESGMDHDLAMHSHNYTILLVEASWLKRHTKAFSFESEYRNKLFIQRSYAIGKLSIFI